MKQRGDGKGWVVGNRFERGNRAGIVILNSKNREYLNNQEKKSRVTGQCWDVYYESYENGVLVYEEYLGSYCDEDTAGPGDGDIGGGGGPFYNKLCPPTNWATVGNSSTANLQGLSINFTNISVAQTVNVSINSSCISIPNYNIPSYQAGSVFAQAATFAKGNTQVALNANMITPTSASIRNYFVASLQSTLNSLAPGSSYSTSPCLGNVPLNNANFGCN